MLGVIYIQLSILTKCCSNKYRYFQKKISNSIDTSKLVFEQVSILQKMSSFTALVHSIHIYVISLNDI